MPQAVASIRGIRVIPVMPGIRAGCQALGVCGTRDTFRPARTLATRFQMEVGPRRYAVGTFFHDKVSVSPFEPIGRVYGCRRAGFAADLGFVLADDGGVEHGLSRKRRGDEAGQK